METLSRKQQIIGIAILLAVAVISIFLLAGIASSEDTFSGTSQLLDDKRVTVTELMGGAAAASTAISLLPGDAGTPIAEQLADLSGYFMFIMAAICLEKWLLTITGALAFRILIPIACGLLILWLLSGKNILWSLGLRLALVALMMFAIIPVSGVVSQKIDASYQASMEQTIEESKKESDAIRKAAESKEDDNALEKLLNKVKGGVSVQVSKFENTLKQMTEAIAVLLVTCCAIPIAVMVFFLWMIRLITGIQIQLPNIKASGFIGKIKGR